MSPEYTVPSGVIISSFSVLGMRAPSTRLDFVDAALHIEIAFGDCVVLALENLFEAADRLRHRDLFPFAAGEDLRDAEWLAQETLNLAGAQHRKLVVRRKLIHAEDRDDILQIFESLQHLLDAARDIVVLVADDLRRQRSRGGGQGVDGRIDSQLRDGPLQNDGGV